MLRYKPTKIALALLSAIAILSACGGGDAAGLLASAKSYLAKNDSKSAVIELKNTLQKSPDLAEARFLLGKAYLDGGDAASASVELRRAFDLKYPEAQVLPLLANSMLAEGQTKKLIEQYGKAVLADSSASASLKTSIAIAYGTQNDLANARAATDAALVSVPGFAPALRMQARLFAMERRFDEALALVDRVVATDPSDAEAWHAKGEFLIYGKSDVAGAIDAYRRSLAAKPDYAQARASLITGLLAKHDLPAAADEIELMRKAMPRHPQTAYFDAQLAFFKNDFKRAHGITQQLVRVSPDSVSILQLAGAVELNMRLFLEAERSLSRAIQLSPNLPLARRLLAQTHLRLGQPAKALSVLGPLLGADVPDAEAAALAAEANLQSGDLQQAEAYFSKVATLNPQDVRSRVALALGKIAKGQRAQAITDITAIAATDTGTFADLTLVSLYLRTQEFDRALAVIQRVEAKQPDSPLTANVQGRVYLLRGDTAKARGSFERALALNPAFVPAASSLALLDLADKQPETAQKRFESILASDPKNLDALLALAGMRVKAGATSEELVGLLANAIKLNPTEAGPRVLLIDHHLEGKNFKAALTSAQEAVAALPSSPQILDGLGRSQLAAGDSNQASATFGKLAGLDPRSPVAHMRLAGMQMAAKNSDAAIQSLKRALDVSPSLLSAQRMLIDLHVAANRTSEAMEIARSVQKQRPEDPAGLLLEGNINAAGKKFPAAVETYRAAVKRFPASSESAVKLYSALGAVDKSKEAEQFVASWTSSHPKDAIFLFYLGEAALAKNNYMVAEERFRSVLVIAPDNAAALNNVAWIMSKLNKPGAVEYAQRATALVPNSASLMDTLATAFAAENQLSKAVEAQTKAVSLDPANPALRLSLAKLHIRAGDKDRARSELEALGGAVNGDGVRAEVDQLKKTL